MRATGHGGPKVWVWLLLLVAVATLGACERGRDDEGRPSTAGTTAPVGGAAVPQGYRLHVDTADGFRIAVPDAWQQVPLDPSALDQTSAANPQMAAMVEQARAVFRQGGLFLAADPRPTSGFAANATLIKVDGPAFTLDEIQPAVQAQLQLAGATDVSFDRAETPAGRALRGHYTLRINTPAGLPLAVRGSQHYIAAGDRGYVLTVTASDAAELAGLERIASTFDLL